MKLPLFTRQQIIPTWKHIAWPKGMGNWPYMNPGELESLLAVIGLSQHHDRMVEIGVNEGRTAKLVLDRFPFSSYIGIDVPPGYRPSKPIQRQEVPATPGRHVKGDPRFRLLLMPNGSLDVSPGDVGVADVIFIDGDHGARAVEHDSALAKKIVLPGGLIIWHDYHHVGTVDVAPILERFAEEGRKIFHVEGTWIAFERIET